jgi:hypothetical protein
MVGARSLLDDGEGAFFSGVLPVIHRAALS